MVRDLSGVVPPVVTPFDEDEEIREAALREEIRYHLSAGVSGISVAGSTGEGNALSLAEHERVYEIAVDEAGDSVPIVAGVIATSAREAGEKAVLAREAGADFVMATPPHYQTPTDDGLVEYFAEIGRQGELPILIYDVIEKVDVTADLAARIAEEVPDLYGIKQSGGDAHGLARMLEEVGADLTIVSALDDLLYPSYALGAQGAIAGVNAIYPRVSVELWEAMQDGDYERGRKLHRATLPLARATVWDYEINFPAGVKAAIEMLGRNPGNLRTPMHWPSQGKLDEIQAAIDHMRRTGVSETQNA